MYSCIFLTPLSFSLSLYQCIHLPLPESSLYLNVFPLTIHSSICRVGLKSPVTVQSGVNWQMRPVLLGWGEWARRRTGRGGKEITAEWRAFGMEKERLPLFTVSAFFIPSSLPHYRFLSLFHGIFSPQFSMFTHVSSLHRTFFIYQTHPYTYCL